MLQRLDPTITISVAWNGGEALDYLSNPSPACPRPDIILMDVSYASLLRLIVTSPHLHTIDTNPE